MADTSKPDSKPDSKADLKPDRSEWAGAFDRLTKEHEGQYLTIELLDPEYGDQHEAERLPFAYAAYDPRDDVVIVAVGGNSPRYPVVLRHMVWHPSEVDLAPDGAFRVVEQDGTTTLVSFFAGPAS
jgi:hypothetical protein